MILKNLLRVFELTLKIVPDIVYDIILKFIPNFKTIQNISLYRFGTKLNFDMVKSDIHFVSLTGKYDYSFFNMCLLSNMIGDFLYVLSKGAIPIVNIENEEGNIWDLFLKQPFCEHSDKKYENCEGLDTNTFYPGFSSIYKKEEIRLWCKFYQYFIHFNSQTELYLQNEYQKVIPSNSRVLGVLCRGTDYTALKPKYHPVQPDLEAVVELVKVKFRELNCDYIYVASDEFKPVEVFEINFPGRVLVNRRTYYDCYYSQKAHGIGDVFFDRENDRYLRSIEYISSINILSKCNALIAGNTTGSCTALFMNNMKYEYYYIFNLGLY